MLREPSQPLPPPPPARRRASHTDGGIPVILKGAGGSGGAPNLQPSEGRRSSSSVRDARAADEYTDLSKVKDPALPLEEALTLLNDKLCSNSDGEAVNQSAVAEKEPSSASTAAAHRHLLLGEDSMSPMQDSSPLEPQLNVGDQDEVIPSPTDRKSEEPEGASEVRLTNGGASGLSAEVQVQHGVRFSDPPFLSGPHHSSCISSTYLAPPAAAYHELETPYEYDALDGAAVTDQQLYLHGAAFPSAAQHLDFAASLDQTVESHFSLISDGASEPPLALQHHRHAMSSKESGHLVCSEDDDAAVEAGLLDVSDAYNATSFKYDPPSAAVDGEEAYNQLPHHLLSLPSQEAFLQTPPPTPAMGCCGEDASVAPSPAQETQPTPRRRPPPRFLCPPTPTPSRSVSRGPTGSAAPPRHDLDDTPSRVSDAAAILMEPLLAARRCPSPSAPAALNVEAVHGLPHDAGTTDALAASLVDEVEGGQTVAHGFFSQASPALDHGAGYTPPPPPPPPSQTGSSTLTSSVDGSAVDLPTQLRGSSAPGTGGESLGSSVLLAGPAARRDGEVAVNSPSPIRPQSDTGDDNDGSSSPVVQHFGRSGLQYGDETVSDAMMLGTEGSLLGIYGDERVAHGQRCPDTPDREASDGEDQRKAAMPSDGERRCFLRSDDDYPSGCNGFPSDFFSTNDGDEADYQTSLEEALRQAESKNALLQIQLADVQREAKSAVAKSELREEECRELHSMVDMLQRELAAETGSSRHQCMTEAQQWQARHDIVVAELAQVKVQMAEQLAILDRLGLHPPFSDALLGAAHLRLANLEPNLSDRSFGTVTSSPPPSLLSSRCDQDQASRWTATEMPSVDASRCCQGVTPASEKENHGASSKLTGNGLVRQLLLNRTRNPRTY